jgi:isoaspartyl peptidase/L-asparaginase-like protein (Ntn-hydrolase superfamily)
LGGLIVLDKDGNYAFSFNTPGMYRGVVFEDGTMMIEFYK